METMNDDEKKYALDWVKYKNLFEEDGRGAFELNEKYMFPCLKDYRLSAGSMDVHYYGLDILVASLIIKSGVKTHFDVGSRIDGLVSHLLSGGVSVTEMDIRPLKNYVPGFELGELRFVQGDATNLENVEDNSILSLSSLHAVEHFGLGRYGDEVNPNACFLAMEALQRVLKPEGLLYFAVPVSNVERVCFNAHRIFNPMTVIETMNNLKLIDLYFIHNMEINKVDINHIEEAITTLGEYDCGIFLFEK